jgi:hypothetical protein
MRERQSRSRSNMKHKWMRQRGRRHRNNRKSGFRNLRSVARGISAFHGVMCVCVCVDFGREKGSARNRS